MATGEVENKKQVAVIGIAILAGGIATFLVGQYVQTRITEETRILAKQYEHAQKQREQQFNEQVAMLNQKIVSVEQSAKKAVEEAAKAAAERAKQQKGPAPTIKKSKPSLAGRTPPGKRALTVMIDSLGAVGGLINPGDSVDVIAHLNIPKILGESLKAQEENKDKKEIITAMIFQGLLVLAVNTNLDEPGAYDDQQKEKTLKITFAVNPEEASLLAFAERNGKLELSLRPQNEKSKQMIAAATWQTLGEYVLQNHGAELKILDTTPIIIQESAPIVSESPAIAIYKGKKEK